MVMIPPADRLALMSLGHRSNDGRWRTEAMRAHATPRLLILSRGQARLTISGRVRGIGANNLVFIPAGTLYGIELGSTGFGQLLTIPRAMASEWPEDVCHLRLTDVAEQKELATLLDQLEKEVLSGRPAASRAAHYRAGLLAIFFERQMELHDTLPETTAAERLVEAYAGLIAQDYRSQSGVACYAAQLGVTPTHLTRSCRQTCGRSALSLLNDRKMYEARRLLRGSNRPVGEIAKALGFGSAAYFTRAFAQATGSTPSAFRSHGAPAMA